MMSSVKRKREVEAEKETKQFTASKLLKSAYESSRNELKTVDFKIADLDELHYFQQRKRTEFENALRMNRFNFGQWLRYAQFEVDQKDLPRARSIFERALEVDYKNVPIWIRYIRTEIKDKNINHARNLLERATKLLPRVDKLWYLYITIEESIGNIVAVSEIFEDWIQWKPNKKVWINYLEFKQRYNEIDDTRLIFEKLVKVFNDSDSWIKWVEFETKFGDVINIENVFKLSINSLYSINKLDSKILIKWIELEYKQKRLDKVKELYDFGFKSLNNDSEELKKLKKFQINFNKQYGVESENIENYILEKRKLAYEEQLNRNTKDYETWWIYMTLLIDSTLEISNAEIQQKFQSLISNIPNDDSTKSEWLSYWYLNYRFVLWEEYDNKNIENARRILKNLINVLPHKKIMMVEFWIKYSEFELRNANIETMRKILGQGIGMSSNEEIVKHYINIEIKLKYFDRVRKLFDKLLELNPQNPQNWIDYFNFEFMLGNYSRSYDLIETVTLKEDFLGSSSKLVVIDEIIDRLTENYNFKLSRDLLDLKISITTNDDNDGNDKMNSIIERCLFELKVPTAVQIEEFQNSDDNFEFKIESESIDNVRAQYEKFLKTLNDDNDKILLLESYKNFEAEYGTSESIETIKKRLPKIVKKVRTVDGINEEYIEYLFPDDERRIDEQVEDFKNEFMNEILMGEEEGEVEEEEEEMEEAEDKPKSFKSRFASDSEDEDEDEYEDDEEEEE